MYVSIVDALISLGCENSDWVRIVGETYDGIEWVDEEKFTQEEVETELSRLLEEKERKQYQELRALEYPNYRDYLDGIVKGDQAQIQDYIDKCLAVKAKYPKPEN